MGLSLFASAACSEPAGDARNRRAAVLDHSVLVERLRGGGYTVEMVGDVAQPFLSVKGKVLHARRPDVAQPEEMQFFEYKDEAAAQSDARRIAPDGSVQGSKIFWIAPPHFFKRGRLLVIYLGSNPELIRVLTEVLGSPFARG